MSADHSRCDKCELDRREVSDRVTLGDTTYALCRSCAQELARSVEYHRWSDRLSEAHYENAVAYLRSLDEVWCVIGDRYFAGELWVHTPYCSAAVVRDVCEHYGFQIAWFSIVSAGEHQFDCVEDHGPCIEINLDYGPTSGWPRSLDVAEDLSVSNLDMMKDGQKLFERQDM